MRINTNLPALSAYKSLNATNNALSKTIKALSTGLRVNSAADDSAGLAISERIRAQVSGLDQAVRNTQDGISMLQTAEGAIESTQSILQRMRELAVQAANDTLTAQDRQFIQLEVDGLRDEVDNIATQTLFNGKRLLDGSASGQWSSSDVSVKAHIRGSLTSVDQFGQKVSAEGNYKLQVRAQPGTGQAQKTNIFKIKHRNVVMGLVANEEAGVASVKVDNVPAGDYRLTSEEPTEARAVATGAYGLGLDELDDSVKVHVSQSNLHNNASILFEVTDMDEDSGMLTLRATSHVLRTDGSTETFMKTFQLKAGGGYVDLSEGLGLGDPDSGGTSADGAMEMKLESGKAGSFSIGDKFVYNLNVAKDVKGADVAVKIENTQNAESPDAWEETMEIQSSNTFEEKAHVPVPAQVVFVIDNSSTMGSAIDEVKRQINAFAAQIKAQGVDDLQIGIATYWGTLDARSYPNGTYWSTDLNEIQTLVNGLSVSGASVDPYTAVESAVSAYYSGASTVQERHIVLITDTGDEVGGSSLSAAQAALAGENITLSAVYRGHNAQIQPLITSGGMDMDIDSSTWGDTLTNQLGTQIGNNALINSLYENTPLHNFSEFSSVFPDTGAASRTITVEQDGRKTQVTIGPSDTLSTIAQKLKAATGVETSAGLSESDSGKKLVSLRTAMDAGKGRVTYSGDDELIALLGLRSSLDQKFSLDASAVKNMDVRFRNFYLNSENGTVHEGDIILTTNDNELKQYETLATFEAAYVGQIAKDTTRLKDIDRFWNTSGVFLLEDAQTLTITQGDGKQATVTVYATDTVGELRAKLNNAIANDLGQAQYINGGGTNNFVSFVNRGEESSSGLDTVAGTFVFRSLIPGSEGRLTVTSSNEDLNNAFAMNMLQESVKGSFLASLYNAHTGATIASNVKVEENRLVGIPHANVDIEFNPMANIKALWSDTDRNFILTSGDEIYEAFIHLVDNSTVLQVGANEGEDFSLDIGSLSSASLGIRGVNVLTRETAVRAIGQLDAAINRTSSQRAKIGAYQNSLEYTAENLTTTSTNLTAAESRIQDADMAKEMMELVKLQILNQSGTSMLAQANQLPQSVLSMLQ